jgi:hypothetical protein
VPRAAWASALAALLLVSLGLKHSVPRYTGEPDEARLASDIARRLTGAGLSAHVVQTQHGPVVIGRNGQCRLIVRNADQSPALRVVMANIARQFGPLTFRYRGRTSAAPPRLRPAGELLAQRTLAPIGVRLSRPALLAIAAGPACGDISPKFDGLTTVLQREP